jgi:leader peptidase (prepilin peptidase)/N-methyltransferase
MSCDQPIAWYDNIPLLSYFVLRGRCRRCKAPIARRYPLAEAVTALLVALCVWVFGLGLGALLAAFFCWAGTSRWHSR